MNDGAGAVNGLRERGVHGIGELKGGAWTSHFLRATPWLFNDAAATMFDDDTGFRCAVAADPRS